MIRVLIADDQESIRQSLRIFLEIHGDITIVAEASDGPTAVARARETRPDVVLMDVRMPGGDGLTATAQLAGPGVADPIPVVVVTTFDLDEYLFGALERGAAGFLLKDSRPEQLVDAVRCAAAGDGLVAPAVTRRVISEFAKRSGETGSAETSSPAEAPDHQLTPREREVLAEIARGASNAEIAEALVVEIGTVKTHVSSIIAKLGVRDRIQAVVWAHQHPTWNTREEGRLR